MPAYEELNQTPTRKVTPELGGGLLRQPGKPVQPISPISRPGSPTLGGAGGLLTPPVRQPVRRPGRTQQPQRQLSPFIQAARAAGFQRGDAGLRDFRRTWNQQNPGGGGGGGPIGGGGGGSEITPPTTPGLPSATGGPLDFNSMFQQFGQVPQGLTQADYDRQRSQALTTARAQSARGASDMLRRSGGNITGAAFGRAVGDSALGAVSGAEARAAGREAEGRERQADRTMQARQQQLGVGGLALQENLGSRGLGLDERRLESDIDYRNRALALEETMGMLGIELDWARFNSDAEYRRAVLALQQFQAGMPGAPGVGGGGAGPTTGGGITPPGISNQWAQPGPYNITGGSNSGPTGSSAGGSGGGASGGLSSSWSNIRNSSGLYNNTGTGLYGTPVSSGSGRAGVRQ